MTGTRGEATITRLERKLGIVLPLSFKKFIRAGRIYTEHPDYELLAPDEWCRTADVEPKGSISADGIAIGADVCGNTVLFRCEEGSPSKLQEAVFLWEHEVREPTLVADTFSELFDRLDGDSEEADEPRILGICRFCNSELYERGPCSVCNRVAGERHEPPADESVHGAELVRLGIETGALELTGSHRVNSLVRATARVLEQTAGTQTTVEALLCLWEDSEDVAECYLDEAGLAELILRSAPKPALKTR